MTDAAAHLRALADVVADWTAHEGVRVTETAPQVDGNTTALVTLEVDTAELTTGGVPDTDPTSLYPDATVDGDDSVGRESGDPDGADAPTLADVTLTAAQQDVVDALQAHGELTTSDVEQVAERSTAWQRLSELQEKDIVTRRKDPDDGRRYLYALADGIDDPAGSGRTNSTGDDPDAAAVSDTSADSPDWSGDFNGDASADGGTITRGPYAPQDLGTFTVKRPRTDGHDYPRCRLAQQVGRALNLPDRATLVKDGGEWYLEPGSGEIDMAVRQDRRVGAITMTSDAARAMGVSPGDEITAHDDGGRVWLEIEREQGGSHD